MPDAARLAGVEDVVLRSDELDLALDVRVDLWVILLRRGLRRRHQRRVLRVGRQLGPLPLRLAAEGLLVALRPQQVDAPLLDVAIGEQAHGQFVPLEQHRVGVGRRLVHLLSKVGQLLLADDASVSEPAAVRLHARGLHLAHCLAHGQPTALDGPLLVALHLGAVHVETVDRGRAAHSRPTGRGLGRHRPIRVGRSRALPCTTIGLASAAFECSFRHGSSCVRH